MGKNLEALPTITFEFSQSIDDRKNQIIIGQNNNLILAITTSMDSGLSGGTIPGSYQPSYNGNASLIYITGWNQNSFKADMSKLIITSDDNSKWQFKYYPNDDNGTLALMPSANIQLKANIPISISLSNINVPIDTQQQVLTLSGAFFNVQNIMISPYSGSAHTPVDPPPNAKNSLTKDVQIQASKDNLSVIITDDSNNPWIQNSFAFGFSNSTAVNITGYNSMSKTPTLIQFTLLAGGGVPGTDEMATSKELQNANYYNLEITQGADSTDLTLFDKKKMLGGNYTWQYNLPAGDTIFKVDSPVEFKFSNMVTTLGPGFTELYIQWQNINGYADGSYSLPIEKKYDIVFQLDYKQMGYMDDTPQDYIPYGVNLVFSWNHLDSDPDFGDDNKTWGISSIIINQLSSVLKIDDIIPIPIKAQGSYIFPTILKCVNNSETQYKCALYTIDKNGTNYKEKKSMIVTIQNLIPQGTVIAWYGDITHLPDGWVLCDGNNGAPDLRNKFILGADNNSYKTTGGNTDITLTIDQMPSHNHGVNDPGHVHSYNMYQQSSPCFTNKDCVHWNADPDTSHNTHTDSSCSLTGVTIQNTGSNSPVHIMPPYYALFYIYKI